MLRVGLHLAKSHRDRMGRRFSQTPGETRANSRPGTEPARKDAGAARLF